MCLEAAWCSWLSLGVLEPLSLAHVLGTPYCPSRPAVRTAIRMAHWQLPPMAIHEHSSTWHTRRCSVGEW